MIKKQLKQFIESFKLKFNFIQIIFYDLLFYAIVYPSTYLAGKIITKQGSKISPESLTQEAMAQITPDQLKLLMADVNTLMFTTIIVGILLAVILLLSWSFTRGMIYSTLLKKKFTKKYFKKLIGLNLFLAVILIPILLFISGLLKTKIIALMYASTILLTALIYFIALIFIKLTKTNKVFESIGNALEFGAKNIPKLLIPGILILAAGYIIRLLSTLAPQILIISVLLYAAYMAWARIYFVSEVEKIK
ncbi:hypothetical protein KY332_01570 [Candidatus Woesearchaeota archaeon]|nr:hypothetical protein [Candidatus Woesearchaeota archaeon]